MTLAHEKDPRAGNTGPFENQAYNVQIVALHADDEKRFHTLEARFALCGHALHRTHHTDGSTSFYAERWGMVRYLADLADARRVLAQIGGAS